MSSQVAKAARRVTHELHGIVVSAGLMQKTVKVRVGGQRWNKVINKVCIYVSLLQFMLLTNRPKVVCRPQALSRTRPQLLPAYWRRCFYCSRLADIKTQASRCQEDHRAVRNSSRGEAADSYIRRAYC